jgi:hypothetical protein
MRMVGSAVPQEFALFGYGWRARVQAASGAPPLAKNRRDNAVSPIPMTQRRRWSAPLGRSAGPNRYDLVRHARHQFVEIVAATRQATRAVWPRLRRYLSWLCGAVLPVLLLACGGGGEATPPVVASVDGAGATLEVRSADGGQLAVVVPAQALEQATEISIEPLAQDAGTVARFRVKPAGLALLAKATLRYTAPMSLPAGTVLRWRIGSETFAMPTTHQGSVLQVQVYSLGYVLGAGTAATGSGREGMASRSTGRANADTAGEAAVELEVATIDCETALPLLGQQIDSAISVDDIGRAQALFDQAQAVLMACQLREASDLKRRACDAYESAALAAQAIAVDSYARFRQVATPLLLTQADVQLTDATCSAPDLNQLLEAKFNQFLDFIAADYTRADFGSDFDATRHELRRLLLYQGGCETMALGSACQRFGSQLLPTVLDAMRAAAYRECRLNGNLSLLSQMYAERTAVRQIVQSSGRERPLARSGNYLVFGSFRYEDLENDLAHCRSTLGIRVFADALGIPEEVESQRVELQGGSLPGQHDTMVSVTVPRDGSVNLNGAVNALECPDGSTSADEVVARVNGVRLAGRPVSGRTFALNTSPFDLVVPTLLAQLGLDRNHTAEFTVDLFREGAACDGLFSNALKLYSVRVGLETAADVAGSYTGTFASTIATATGQIVPVDVPINLTLTQAQDRVTGTYEVMLFNGPRGTVSADVSGERLLNISLGQSGPCTGSFAGSATVDPTTRRIIASYAGSDCQGTHTNGRANVSPGTRLLKDFHGTWVSFFNGQVEQFWKVRQTGDRVALTFAARFRRGIGSIECLGRFEGTVTAGSDVFTADIVGGRIPDFFSEDTRIRWEPGVLPRSVRTTQISTGIEGGFGFYTIAGTPPAGCDP